MARSPRSITPTPSLLNDAMPTSDAIPTSESASTPGKTVTVELLYPLALRALVTSTEAGFPKGDLGWRSSV